MRVLVTGSSGTVGTRLAERLLDNGCEVVGWDRRNNEYLEQVQQVTQLVNLCESNHVTSKRLKEISPIDVVVHLANHARVSLLVRNPTLALENMEMNFNILEGCRLAGINQVIMASSREVYGNTPPKLHQITSDMSILGKSEDDALIETCESPYAASKLQGEALAHAYVNCYGMNIFILRLSNVYGMYDFSDRVVPTWIKAIYAGQPLVVYGWQKSLDFTYIDDTVDGIMKAMDRVSGVKTYNISSGWSTPLIEAAQLLGEITGKKAVLQIEPAKTGEVINYQANVEFAFRYLSFRARVRLKEGLEKTIAWYKEIGYV